MTMRTRRVDYRVLSMNKCARVHEASLETLERTGCKVEAPEALELLRRNGCRLDGDRVRIPSSLVKQALQSVPQKVALYDRLGKRKMILEGSNTRSFPRCSRSTMAGGVVISWQNTTSNRIT